jgi:hypothetical protein
MLVLRQAARKSEQTERAGDKKSHKGGSSLQVNIRQYSRSIDVRAWLFDYEFLKKAAQWPRGSVVSSVLDDLRMCTSATWAHGRPSWLPLLAASVMLDGRAKFRPL